MKRMSGQDASFLYSETPTVLMHTLKIQIFDSSLDPSNYEELRDRMETTLDVVPMLRQRVLFVPFNLHHPVMVDDPDFDLDSHIYRAALPAPGGRSEFDQMVSQIMCHRLDRQRPLWELWVITGLQDRQVAVVHKIHHCLADGAATVRYLSRVFESQAGHRPYQHAPWRPQPLPSTGELVWNALRDHVTRDVLRLPGFLASLWRRARELRTFDRDVGSPTIKWFFTDKPVKSRLNRALSARRTFTTRQFSLADAKAIGTMLGGTVNDVVLALAAGAIRNYLLHHCDLPAEPLVASVPVSADEPGAVRETGNCTTSIMACLWTNLDDPLERFRAIRKSMQIAKDELALLGRNTLVELVHYMPPALAIRKARRQQRLRLANQPDFHPLTNVIISNVPGPKERVSGAYGTLVDLYSMGPLVEGVGLNITVWSYAGWLNFSLMSCKNAVPDIDQLADGLLETMDELQTHAAGQSGAGGHKDEDAERSAVRT